MVILNTCHIREKAAEKVYSELGRSGALKDEKAESGGRMLVAVAGCVAQAEGAEIVARAAGGGHGGGAAILSSPARDDRAAWRAEAAMCSKTDFPALEKFDTLPEAASDTGVSAFLTVQEGCDKFCTFCVVPYTRGAEHSRAAGADPARGARAGPAKGAREIVLLGQNVNAYRGSDGAAGLDAGAPDRSDRRDRRRLAHPLHHQPSARHGRRPDRRPSATIEKLMPYLHLPVQSGSDSVLAAMNRQHTADDYRRLIERIRAVRPDIALFLRFHRRLSRRNRRGFRSHPGAGARRRLRAMLFRSNTVRGPARRRHAAQKQIAESVKSARLDALQKLLLSQQDAANRGRDRQDHAGAVRKAGPQCRARSLAARPTCSRSMSKRPPP